MASKLPQPVMLSGTVIHGEKVGRTIGFPTANLDTTPDEKQLATGVYFGTCVVNRQTYSCLPYFGPRFVFGETKNVFEVYIYDFSDDIYGQTLKLELTHYLRPPQNVHSLDELKTLLEHDKAVGLELQ